MAHSLEPEKVTARLEWTRTEGGEECPSDAELRDAVNERWGRTVFGETGAEDIHVVGRVGPGDTGWKADIQLFSRQGEPLGSRTLTAQAERCGGLKDSVALAVGLMLDVTAQRIVAEREAVRAEAERTAAETRQAEVERIEAARIEAQRADAERRAQAEEERWRVAPHLGGGLAFGMLPGATPTIVAGVTFTPPRFWSFYAGGSLYGSKDATGGAGGASLDLWTAGLGLCPLTLGATTRVEACAGPRFGAVQSRGFGFDDNVDSSRWLVDATVAVRFWLPIARPLALLVAAEGDVPITRYRFFYTTRDGAQRSLFTVAPITGDVFLAFALEL